MTSSTVPLLAAVRSGMVAGFAYAVAETLFTVVLPGYFQKPDLYQPVHLGVTALLFLVYPLIASVGALLLTAIFQYALKLDPERLRRAADSSGQLFVLAVVVWNLLWPIPDTRLHFVAVAVAAASAATIIRNIADPAVSAMLRPLALPWVAVSVPVAIAVSPVLVEASAVIRLTVASVLTGLVLAPGFLRRVQEAGTRAVMASLTVVSALTLVGAWAVDKGGYIRLNMPTAAVAAQPRPNVLFIVMDTVRADHMSLYGYTRDTTPNLKTLATDPQTTVFRQMRSAADWTLPSHASMFTGLYPSQHGSNCDARKHDILRLPDSAITLAERLRADGYSTVGVVANITSLLRNFAINQGFDYYATRLPANPLYGGTLRVTLRRRLLRYVDRLTSQPENPRIYPTATNITAEIVRLLPQLRAGRHPWLLFANYMDAHTPYNPPAPFENRYSSSPRLGVTEYFSYGEAVMKQRQQISPSVMDPIIARYDAGIAYTDEQIGVLFDNLRQQGVYDDTLIIITADHGEAFGEHQLMDHGVSVYEDQIRVPLIIKWPRGVKPPDAAGQASGVDLMPTVLDVAGLKPQPGISGRSLVKPETAATPARFAETKPCNDVYDLHPRFRRDAYALVRGHWKLIASTNGNMELYDLENDPGEERNLFSVETAIATKLTAEYEVWRKHRTGLNGGSAATLSDEERERLKSLGYVQ